MKLTDFLPKKTLNEMFSHFNLDEAGEADEWEKAEQDAFQQMNEPKPSIRHTRTASAMPIEYDQTLNQKTSFEDKLFEVGYKKFTKADMAGLKSPPFVLSNSSVKVKAFVEGGKGFTFQGQKWMSMAIYAHLESRLRGAMVNKVLFEREDGKHFILSETVSMKAMMLGTVRESIGLAPYIRGASPIVLSAQKPEQISERAGDARMASTMAALASLDAADAEVKHMSDEELFGEDDVMEGEGGIYGDNAGGDDNWEPNEMGTGWDPDHGVYHSRETEPAGHETGGPYINHPSQRADEGMIGSIKKAYHDNRKNAAIKKGDWDKAEDHLDMKYGDKPRNRSITDDESKLDEKWGGKTEINPSKKGMFKGKTKAQLIAQRDKLRAKEERTKAESTKLRELNFAIRAKGDWGKADESVKLDEVKLSTATEHAGNAGVYGRTGGGNSVRDPNDLRREVATNKMNEAKKASDKKVLTEQLNHLRKNAGLTPLKG